MSLILETSIKIKSPAAKVWDALINPDIIRQYLFGTNAISDWEEGSTLIFRGEWQGHQYEDKGIITKLEEEKVFQYTYWSGFTGLEDKPENYSEVTFSLSEWGGTTELKLRQIGFVDKNALEHSKKNWDNVLKHIKEIVES